MNPCSLNRFIALKAQYLTCLNGIMSKSSFTVSVSVIPRTELGFHFSVNPMTFRAVSFRMFQKLFCRNINEPFWHQLMCFHNCSVEMSSFTVKLVSSTLFHAFHSCRFLPIPLLYAVYSPFPVALFNWHFRLESSVNSNLLGQGTSPALLLFLRLKVEIEDLLRFLRLFPLKKPYFHLIFISIA